MAQEGFCSYQAGALMSLVAADLALCVQKCICFRDLYGRSAFSMQRLLA